MRIIKIRSDQIKADDFIAWLSACTDSWIEIWLCCSVNWEKKNGKNELPLGKIWSAVLESWFILIFKNCILLYFLCGITRIEKALTAQKFFHFLKVLEGYFSWSKIAFEIIANNF